MKVRQCVSADPTEGLKWRAEHWTRSVVLLLVCRDCDDDDSDDDVCVNHIRVGGDAGI